MERSEALVFDAWTALSFKSALGSRRSMKASAGAGWIAPTWTGAHGRRLQAYTVLRAYLDNAAREFLDEPLRYKIDERREYGDAALLVDTIVAALLGDEQTVVVEGAEDWDPKRPDQVEAGDEPGEARDAWELQEWLRQWAGDERLQMKMLENERDGVSLGDSVWSLGWDPEKGRVRLRCWDPGLYFPVLDDGNEDDYPSRVHIAWEQEEMPDGTKPPAGKTVIRRLTWDLRPIGEGADGAEYDDSGAATRQYPWNKRPSRRTCYFTDATWVLEARCKVDDLREAEATYTVDADGEVRDRDLFVDFVPVVHVPNTVAVKEHFGRSSLAAVLQVLDDLSAADTDLSKAAATTGQPVLALSGARFKEGEVVKYHPGKVFQLGEGKMDVLDTSKSLDALKGYVEFLLKRMATNSRVPEAVMGRVAGEVSSGLELALSFGPLETMVKAMRMSRDEKYPLILKFAHRMAFQYRDGAEGDPPPATWGAKCRVQFGSYLPQDRAAVAELVGKLLSTSPRPAISLETAVAMLVEAGYPIRDAVLEVERIQSRDFQGADDLLSATGEHKEAFEYLGRKMPEVPERPPAPPIVVDPNAPAGGQPDSQDAPQQPEQQ